MKLHEKIAILDECPRVIYVVEPHHLSLPENEIISLIDQKDCYTPNFTIIEGEAENQYKDGEKNQKKIEKILAESISVSTLGKIALSTLPITSLPLALITAAATASPVIVDYITSKKENSSEVENAELNEIENFLLRCSITQKIANKLNYKFPPGHPQTGQGYKLHPLAGFPNMNKNRLYIPQESYDELLLEEREAELLKLLVELGATKITITQKSLTDETNEDEASAKVDASALGAASASGSIKIKNKIENLDTREFELTGKKWDQSTSIERSNFVWVNYEPSWDALIKAREIGGCLKAVIEIKENTSFSNDKKIEASVKSKMYNAGASGSYKSNQSLKTGKTYLVKAEFGAIKEPSA